MEQTTEALQHLLKTFELLPVTEQQQFAVEILKRTVHWNLPMLSDEELVLNAENIFVALDQQEKLHD